MIKRPELAVWSVSTDLGTKTVILDTRDALLQMNHLQWYSLMQALMRSGKLLGWPIPMPEQAE